MFGPADFKIPYGATVDYAHAAKHEAEVKPIRGQPDCKPIGDRRKTHATIRRTEDGSIVCRLYNTDVVRLCPDGTILVDLRGYVTQSTLRLLSSVLHLRAHIQHNRAWVQCWSGGVSGTYALRANEVNIFQRDEGNKLVFLNPAPVRTHKVNRKEANSVRRDYAAFTAYVTNTMKLRGDKGYSDQEMLDVFGNNRVGQIRVSVGHTMNEAKIPELLALARSEDPADQYKASLWLAQSTHASRWLKPTLQDMLKHFDTLVLFQHRERCFIEQSAPQGVAARDPYAKFFG